MTTPLVIGAGPTGLAVALLLARRGIEVRIVERRTDRQLRSKALIVNPRSLELLRHTGASAGIAEAGRELTGIQVWRDGRSIARVGLDPVGGHARHLPIVLPQSTTEELLEAALRENGVEVERGVELLRAGNEGPVAWCELQHGDGRVERVETSALVGADGSRSRVREQLHVEFVGATYPSPFSLADVHLAGGPLSGSDANVFVQPEGGMLALRIAGDLWRLAGPLPEPLTRLPAATAVGEVRWESTFDVSHRIAARMLVGRCALAGDAAHVHSPLGGRGMNLGIEDAYVLATLIAEDRLDAYDRLRRPVDTRVMRRVRRMTDVARSGSRLARAARSMAPGLAGALLPLAAPQLRTWVMGLDHPVELFER